MDDDLQHLATLIPARGEPVRTLDDTATGSWRVRASRVTVRLDLDARTVVRSTDTVPTLTPDPLDGRLLALEEIRSCAVGEPLSLRVRDEDGRPATVRATKVRYVQPVDPEAGARRERHLRQLAAAVAAGSDSRDDRIAAVHFGATWAAVGEVHDISGVQAAARWKEPDREVLARLRAARGETGTPAAPARRES
ncbi:hypothetical protein GTR02_15085 [Kineococcus sp. R8]|uniref:hypothetical protein n=1 Tax=Kineococcus siccus TaxID=2696567 RepID=UPI001412E38C|nr:hypothetical protein [Kineococcus siccus]NAZ83143.1 hypothetical protein [Kineococcus siccus]